MKRIAVLVLFGLLLTAGPDRNSRLNVHGHACPRPDHRRRSCSVLVGVPALLRPYSPAMKRVSRIFSNPGRLFVL